MVEGELGLRIWRAENVEKGRFKVPRGSIYTTIGELGP